ncbi:uncharacterized protein DUF448 [Naumannella halotolerans]|uniref:Uncharacterized protein DUF448 n=1 Tax=Naumannella halotolerans TaxID=993414 RepID=A0A4R7J821_9ACTN|nr:uncharacterized protein DUF448 [Naumannella halotolerans]
MLQRGLLRLALQPDPLHPQTVRVVFSRTAAGRGAWLHPDPDCLELARRRRAIPRALRVPVTAVEIDFEELARRIANLPGEADATALGSGD